MIPQKDRIEAAIRHIKTSVDIDPWAMELAVDALKKQADLQPNCNELATDCINRQDAIDHWRLIIDATSTDSRYNMGFVDGLEFCISHLSTMPSAQPEPTTEIQDILDYLDTELHPIISPEHWNVYSELHDMISTLPSAQQKTISEDYAKAVRNWLVHYQVKCAELQGRYTPYEVLGWVVSDWRKENEIW